MINIIEYKNHNNLISFYLSRGIEISEEFENPPIISYIIEEKGNLIAAVTCSEVNGTFIIEAIAVSKQYERRHIGTELLNFTINKLKSMGDNNIILNAKNPILFEKNGFMVISKDEVPIDSYSYCFDCPDYQVSCFPKIMKFVKKIKDDKEH